ncbi:MAG: hypothetical protein KJZ80_19985 [Hyphomicrobiaceae bacterium]|nr:hypothetical protein [Hyphomicrobiaceae bacterium]
MPTVVPLIAVALSLGLLVLTADGRATDVRMAYAHAAVAAATALLVAGVAVRQCRRLLDKGGSAIEVASSNAWYMGVVWSWGMLALVATYGTGVLAWKEWWHFVLAFGAAAGLSLYFAAALKRGARSGKEDESMLRLARYLAIVQLVGMAATMLGLVVDGKMVRFLTPRFTDWAANNVFFFGALGIAVISAYALRNNKHA